jgi:hypothetical protein
MIQLFAPIMVVVFLLMFVPAVVVGKGAYVTNSLVIIEIPAPHMEHVLVQTIAHVFQLMEEKIAQYHFVLDCWQQTQKFVHLMEFVIHLINVYALLLDILELFVIIQFVQTSMIVLEMDFVLEQIIVHASLVGKIQVAMFSIVKT